MSSYDSYSDSTGSSVSDEAEEEGTPEKFTFFSDVSMFELAFGVGATPGVSALCVGMMLNIPTAELQGLMYEVVPRGLLHATTTDQERVSVAKAIIDHWLLHSMGLTRKQRFKQLHDVFITLREKEIADGLKEKFEANDSISLEMFRKFDMERLGPYVPPKEGGEEEGEEEEEEVEEEGSEAGEYDV